MKNGIAYYRISKNTGETLRQQRDVETYCKNNNIKIIKTFEEKKSGAKRNRPIILEMFEYLENNKIDFLVISELSRIGRTNEVTILTDKLKELNVCLISIKETIKTINDNKSEDAQAEFIINIWAGMNNYELENIRYRVKSGKDYAVLNKGSWTGSNRYPYGYHTIISYKKTKSKLVINEAEKPIIEMIFEKYCKGWGTVKIANYLTTKKIETRTKKMQWARTTIIQILKNTLYVGKRNYNNETINVPELRIISDYQFNNVQQRLKERSNNSQDFSKLKKYHYMLDNKIIKCSICGKHFFGVHRYNVYKCISKKYSKGCDNLSIRIEWIETEILLYLMSNMIDLLNDNNNDNDETDRIYMMHNERDKITQRLERIKELYVNGDYNKTEYNTKTEKSNEMLLKISKDIAETERRTTVRNTIKTYKTEYLIDKVNVPMESTITKETLHNIIKQIRVNMGTVTIEMINGKTFTLQHPKKKVNQYK